MTFAPGLLRHVASRWASDAPERLMGWQNEEVKHFAKYSASIALAEETMSDLKDFNVYWNRIRYYTDAQHWGFLTTWQSQLNTWHLKALIVKIMQLGSISVLTRWVSSAEPAYHLCTCAALERGAYCWLTARQLIPVLIYLIICLVVCHSFSRGRISSLYTVLTTKICGCQV